MGKLLRDYSEKELIRWLFSDEGLIFTSFAFMFREACGFQIADWELEFWFNLDRKEVGLDPQGKPGDIDVLIVPKFKGDRFVERAMAIEVKKLFASREKPQRSPNAYGTSQVKGLFADGFPFVGLLHMVLVEASHPKHFFAVPVIIGVNRKGEYVYGKSIRTDPAGF